MRKITSMMAQYKGETATGTNLQFENCKGGYLSTEDEWGLKVVGKTLQDGTPSPDNPIDIQCVKQGTKIRLYGKNLCAYPYSQLRQATTVNGLTITPNLDGSITVNGTATAVVPLSFSLSYEHFIPKNTKMTWHTSCDKSFSGSAYVYVSEFSSTSFLKNHSMANAPRTETFTTLDNAKFMRVSFRAEKGAVLDNVTMRFQLELGSAATEIEPYVYGGTLTTPCDLYEGDIWYPMSGRVEHHINLYTFTGNETFLTQPYETENTYFMYTDKTITNRHTNGTYTRNKELCNIFKRHPASIQTVNIDYEVFNFNPQEKYRQFLYFKVDKSRLNVTGTVPEAFKTWLKGLYNARTPMKVWYQLETPVTGQYPPQKAFMPKGYVNMTQTPVELNGDITAFAMVRR